MVPYFLALRILRWVAGRPSDSQLWLRNSFALGYWSFALSDLDVSLWVEGDAVEISQEWERLKPYRPLLVGGEIQIYSSQHIDFFLPYGNPWELRRDPHLIKLAKYPLELRDDMALTVFLVRSIASDRLLRREPGLRQRKWREHLRAFGVVNSEAPVSWDSMVELLHKREPFSHNSASDLSEALQASIDPLATHTPDLHRLIHSNRYVWGFKAGNTDREFIEGCSKEVHEFLYHQLCWEIWGLSPFTLVTQGFSLASLSGHIANQTRLADMLRLSDARRAFLAAGWSRLENFYQPLER